MDETMPIPVMTTRRMEKPNLRRGDGCPRRVAVS